MVGEGVGVVGGAVVDDDDFVVGEGLSEDGLEGFFDVGGFVVEGYDDGETGGGGEGGGKGLIEGVGGVLGVGDRDNGFGVASAFGAGQEAEKDEVVEVVFDGAGVEAELDAEVDGLFVSEGGDKF